MFKPTRPEVKFATHHGLGEAELTRLLRDHARGPRTTGGERRTLAHRAARPAGIRRQFPQAPRMA